MIPRPLGPTLLESDFDAVPDLGGPPLPAPLRAFLLEWNGGRPDRRRFSTRDGKVEGIVDVFMPLRGEFPDTILEEVSSVTLAGWLPPHVVTFATTVTGNRVVIYCAGEDAGAVFYWSWDEQDEDDPASYGFLRRISDDLDGFLGALT